MLQMAYLAPIAKHATFVCCHSGTRGVVQGLFAQSKAQGRHVAVKVSPVASVGINHPDFGAGGGVMGGATKAKETKARERILAQCLQSRGYKAFGSAGM